MYVGGCIRECQGMCVCMKAKRQPQMLFLRKTVHHL